jgi:hypothetical protein
MPDQAIGKEASTMDHPFEAERTLSRMTRTQGGYAAPPTRSPVGRHAVSAARAIGLLALVTLAILVMLPAMIAAQPTFLG